MALSVGIVGLPNVGKSTLFAALTRKKVDIANYPFCTIEPNIGIVKVPDERLDRMAALFSSKKVIPTVIEFVDIAGLVKGASQGEGLGNQFLSHIREVDAIAEVVRSFEDSEISHVESTVDPLRDIDTVETELALKDLETVQKRLFSIEKEVRAKVKGAEEKQTVLQELQSRLALGQWARQYFKEHKEAGEILSELHLLTAKPLLYVVNSENGKVPLTLKERAEKMGAKIVVLNIKEEAESAGLTPQEASDLGISQKLPGLIHEAYSALDLITFFTTGPDETRAWTVKRGATAPVAGGVIHSDFAEKFIRAAVISTEDLLEAGGLQEAVATGKVRTEGKEYVVADGDVIEIRHS
ncbi:MAG: redox-regulated ATPase YchF [bacterium]|nr:redox-regulated ATPase YchF [bacterium]